MKSFSKAAQRAVIYLDSFPKLDYKYKTAILEDVQDPERLYEALPSYRSLLSKAMGEGADELLRGANKEGEERVLSRLKNKGVMPVTRGRPSVIVPVLSSRTVFALLICSMYAPPLISTPRLTAVLIAAENAVAVESLMPQE